METLRNGSDRRLPPVVDISQETQERTLNIFRTDEDPVECAKVLADQHVIKMSLETAQILATSLWLNGAGEASLYKPTHKGHPCVVWAATSRTAANWTLKHGFALCAEYQARFLRVHRSIDQLNLIKMKGFASIPDNEASEIPKCVPDDLRDLPTFEAYRKTLQRKYSSWKRPARWTGSSPPQWIERFPRESLHRNDGEEAAE